MNVIDNLSTKMVIFFWLHPGSLVQTKACSCMGPSAWVPTRMTAKFPFSFRLSRSFSLKV